MLTRTGKPAMLAAAAIAAVLLPTLSGPAEGPATRAAFAVVAALGLFILPGCLIEELAGGNGLSLGERLSVWVVVSLSVLTSCVACIVLAGGGLDVFLPIFGLTVAALATAAIVRRLVSPTTNTSAGLAKDGRAGTSSLDTGAAGNAERTADPCGTAAGGYGRFVVPGLIALLIAFDTFAAWRFTATGSVDRWWYLAYVRQWLDAPAIAFTEPFFGSGAIQPRFGINAWMLAMAAWSRLAMVDPVWIYERACPVLLVPAAFSAVYFLARSVLRSQHAARMSVLSAGLLWAGGTFLPVATRMPEDKIMALLVVAPVTVGAIVRLVARPRRPAVVLATLALLVQALVHPLVYALVLIVTIPYIVLAVTTRTAHPLAAAIALTLLMAGAVYPALSGVAARSTIVERGASFDKTSNPVVRIHHGRDRLRNVGSGGGFIVRPRLLARPLLILSLCSLLLLSRRSRREVIFLLPATVLPLAIAFVPPLARAAGDIILPWMVYRLLWAVPFALLLGVGLDEAIRVWSRRPWVPLLVVLIAAAPWPVRAWQQRSRPERQALAIPRTGGLSRAMDAVGRLPAEAVVAAAPEISERIAALAGRRVLAMSDRGTLVFAESLRAATARLRTRALLMAGIRPAWKREGMATHVLTAPGAPAERLCGRRLFAEDGFVLCTLPGNYSSHIKKVEPNDGRAASRDSSSAAQHLTAFGALPKTGGRAAPQVSSDALQSHVIFHTSPRATRNTRGNATGDDTSDNSSLREDARKPAHVRSSQGKKGVFTLRANCSPPPDRVAPIRWSRPGPWSARRAQALCSLHLVASSRSVVFEPLSIDIVPFVGKTVEELIVVVDGRFAGSSVWQTMDRAVCREGDTISLPLSRQTVDELWIEITPTYLPFLKLHDVRLTYRTLVTDIQP